MLQHVEQASDQSVLHEVEGGHHLRWWPSLGLGYLPVAETVPYDEDYWLKYQSYRGNGIGELLTASRVQMVFDANEGSEPSAVSEVIDIGIGSGEFVEAMRCWGSDINPHAIAWLKDRGCYRDPLVRHTKILTLWDVLEHIEDPKPLLDTAKIILTSLPIYAGVEECLASKHLRPGEHLWHFTDAGIKQFMAFAGFGHVTTSDFETRIGREGILTYSFKRYK